MGEKILTNESKLLQQEGLVGVKPSSSQTSILSPTKTEIGEVYEQSSQKKKLQVEAVPVAAKMQRNLWNEMGQQISFSQHQSGAYWLTVVKYEQLMTACVLNKKCKQATYNKLAM